MKKQLLISLCLVSITLISQTTQDAGNSWQPQLSPEYSNTNESNSLKDITNTGVNYFTGTAVVDIPIFQESYGGLRAGVELNYVADGIKVDDEASWVGLGWTLNTGAIITRQVKGLPDERFYMNPANAGWIQSWQAACANVMSLPMGPYNIPGNFDYFLLRSIEWLSPCGATFGPVKDMEPDLFTANIDGKKIEFILDLNGNPFVLNNNNDYQITRNGYNYTIINEAGVKYFFSMADAETIKVSMSTVTSYSWPGQPQLTYYNSDWYNNVNGYNTTPPCDNTSMFGQNECYIKWNLTKIESPDGKYAIDYSYDTYYYSQEMQSYIYNVEKSTLNQYTYTYNDPFPFSPIVPDHGTYMQNMTNGYRGKRIKKIAWGHGYIQFDANTVRADAIKTSGDYNVNSDCRSLDYIRLFDLNGVEIRRFLLGYSYFTTPVTFTNPIDDYRNKRLKLAFIQEYGSDLVTTKPPYTFDYDGTALPVRGSFEKDFWGYYKANSATHLQGSNYLYANYNNTNLNDFTLWSQFCIYPITLPGSGTPVKLNGADRLPNLANTRACVLNKVHFPMGGYQELQYELHNFCIDNDNINRDAGGLRIKKIITSDGSDMTKNMVRNFYYNYEATTLPGTSTKRSSGEINFLPVFGREAADVYNRATVDLYKIHSDNFAHSVNSGQSQVFYKEVTDEIAGQGNTVYKFETAGTFGHNADVYYGSAYLIAKNKSDNAQIKSNDGTAGTGPNTGLPDHFDLLHKRVNFPYAPEPNSNWINGSIKEVVTRDINNNVLSKKAYNYVIKSASSFKTYQILPIMENWEWGPGSSLNNPPNISGFGPLRRSVTITPYYYLSVWRVLDNEVEYMYNPSSPGVIASAQVKTVNYSYSSANHKFITAVSSVASNGVTKTEKYRYVADFNVSNPLTYSPDAASLALLNMRYKTHQVRNMVEQTIEQTKGTTTSVLGGQLFTYKDLNNTVGSAGQTNNVPLIRNVEGYMLEIGSPLTTGSFNYSAFNAGPSTNLSFGSNSNYARKYTNQVFDLYGNILQSQAENGPVSASVYGYTNVPIAEIGNAKASEVAYTSFESEEVNNWQMTTANIITTDKKTGDKCYDVFPAPSGLTNYDMALNKNGNGLDQNGKYIFSCWVKTTGSYANNTAFITVQSNNNVSLGAAYPVVASAYQSTPIQSNNNDWVYYSVVIDLAKVRSDAGMPYTSGGQLLGLRFFVNSTSSSHILFDEIRIRPFDSFMSSTTLKPLINVTSQMDARNASQGYEYDVLGRPNIVRDLNSNILQKTFYNYR